MTESGNGGRGRSWATLAIAAALFAGLIGLYILTYSGIFKSGDEYLFVGSGVSLGGWGEWSGAPTGLRLIGGNSIEPMVTLLGAGLYRLARFANVGVVHTLFLTNLYLIALTGVVVFLIVRQRGGRPGVAVGAALIFGVGTLAWPQTKLYFRDPPAMFFAALALLSFERLLTRKTWYGQGAQWVVTLGLLGAAVLSKNTATFALVAVLATAVVRAIANSTERRLMLIGLIPLAILGGIMLAIPDNGGPFSRFSLAHYVNWFFRKHVIPDFGVAATGVLVSPGKGLFLESPALLLALVALPLARKGDRLFHLPPWLTLFGIVMGLVYDSGAVWYGGTGWGVRHVLPSVPMLAAACAPALEAIWDSRRRWVKWAGGGLLLVSGLIQLGAALLLPDAYYAWIWRMKQSPWGGAIWNPLYAEAVGYWRLLLSGEALDLAWLRILPSHRLAVAGVILGAGALAAGGLLVWRSVRRGASSRVAGVSLGLAALALTVVPYSLLRAYYPDPYYLTGRDDYRLAADFVTQAARPEEAIVVRGLSDPIWKYFINYVYSPVIWYTYTPYTPDDQPSDAALDEAASTPWLKPQTEHLFEVILPQRYARSWHVSDQCAAWADLRLEERWLAKRYAAASSQLFQAQCSTRVSLFALATAAAEQALALNYRFGDALQLTSAARLASANQGALKPGEVLPLRLEWRLTRPVSTDYTIGVYLLDLGGALKAQQDGAARGGFYPMTRWPVETPVPDQHGLELSGDLPAGSYQVAVAVYNWQTGERLPLSGSGGPVPDNLARVLTVQVLTP